MTTPARIDHDSRLDLLLILRGFAALSVVIWHAEGYKALYPDALNTSGRMAVWLFFGISGYVIAYGFVHGRYRLAAPDLRSFYWNRFLRIYPLFIVLTALAWATEWRMTGANPFGWGDVPGQLFALQWNHSYTLLSVFWTLGIELQFYLLAPLLVMPILTGGRAWYAIPLAMYGALLAWCTFAALTLGWSWDGRNIVSNLPHFLVGMAACRYAASIEKPRTEVALMSAVAAFASLGMANVLYHKAPSLFWSPAGMLVADGTIVCFVLAHAHIAWRPRPRSLAYAAAAMLGTLSYGVYAWHNYLMKYIPWTAEHLFALIALSIAVAYLSYRVVERPALARRKRPVEPVGRTAASVPA